MDYRQWCLVSQSVDLFSHIKGEENHDADFRRSGSKRHDEVYDRSENVHLGTRNISEREIGARFDLDIFTVKMLH